MQTVKTIENKALGRITWINVYRKNFKWKSPLCLSSQQLTSTGAWVIFRTEESTASTSTVCLVPLCLSSHHLSVQVKLLLLPWPWCVHVTAAVEFLDANCRVFYWEKQCCAFNSCPD